MDTTRPFPTGGEHDLGAEPERPMRSRALARMAVTGIYLLRGVSLSLQRTARARAVREGTTLRRVLAQGLHEYAAGTWTPSADTEAATPPRQVPRAQPQFIQTCASHNDLFALDAEGAVHQYNFTTKTWETLVAHRSSGSPERGDRGTRGDRTPLALL